MHNVSDDFRIVYAPGNIQVWKGHHADILLATDLDAVRVGVAMRNSGGEYQALTGNSGWSITSTLFNLGKAKKVHWCECDGVKTIVTF